MRLKTFLKTIDPEVYCRVEHVDGSEVAFSQAESIIKYNDRKLDVIGAYPDTYKGLGGKLGITILVQEIER